MQLVDNLNLCTEHELREHSKKMSAAMLQMARAPSNGGLPFYYALAAGLRFKLRDDYPFCATNGNEVYFNPNHIKNSTPFELMLDIAHEIHHRVSMHCRLFADPMRGKNVNPEIAKFLTNVVLDIYCDTTIDVALTQGSYNGPRWTKHQSITYQELLDCISGTSEFSESWSCIAPEILSRKPDSVYADIEAAWFSNPKSRNPPKSKDGHLTGGSQEDKDKLLRDLLQARDMANMMGGRGSVPGIVEDLIGELLHPKIDLAQYLNHKIFSHMVRSGGDRNNYKRNRRRYVWQDIYLPVRQTTAPKWLGLIDTSGSMSQSKELVISQLRSLPPHSEGMMVPADAEIYWDKYTTIHNVEDLEFTDVTGGGGTVLHAFFRDYRHYFGDDFDLIFALTDGYIDLDMIAQFPPDCDVYWIVVDNPDFQAPFGEVFHVNHEMVETTIAR